MYELGQKKRLAQFGVLSVLICVAIFAACLGFHTRRLDQAKRRDQAVESLRLCGGAVRYQHEVLGRGEPAPEWLLRLFGPSYFRQVHSLHFGQETREGQLRSFNPENRVFDDNLELLRDLPEIRELSLITSNLTTDGLVSMRHLKKLQSFRFGGCGISIEGDGRGLSYIGTCPKLRRLVLHNVPLPSGGLSFVYALPELEELGLVDMKVGDQLVVVRRLSRLKTLDLSGSDVTDDSLTAVVEATSLEHLDLSNTGVTDRGLAALYKLRNLNTLDVHLTGVTHDGVAAIKRELPTCHVKSQP